MLPTSKNKLARYCTGLQCLIRKVSCLSNEPVGETTCDFLVSRWFSVSVSRALSWILTHESGLEIIILEDSFKMMVTDS